MKIILILFSTCLFVAVNVRASDSDCQKQMQNVVQCVKKKHEDNKAADDAKMEKAKKDVQQCFSQKGCDPPNYGETGGLTGTLKQQWDNQPESVKECIKKDMKSKFLEKLNQCLDKQHVKRIDLNDMDAHEIEGMGGEEGEKMMGDVIAVFKALKQCEKDHGAQARQGVSDCLKPIVQQIKTEHCKRVNDCKDSTRVTQECRQRGKEIKDAACKCKKEKLQEARDKIVELQKRGTDVDMDEMKEVGERSGHSMPDMDKVEQCYKDNNEPVPLILTMMKNAGGPGGLMAKFGKHKITQAQLQEMKEMIDEKLKNNDCGC